jgi:hypothetical protein
MRICHIYISPGHNFRGHHGREPDSHPVLELEEIECVAGKGLRGDRYFGYQEDYKGQVTFFAWEVYEALCKQLSVTDKDPSALRRNVIVEGADLGALIGFEFTIQGVTFLGVEECAPCYWMERAFAPGAEEALKGRGGLRARIVTTGRLQKE